MSDKIKPWQQRRPRHHGNEKNRKRVIPLRAGDERVVPLRTGNERVIPLTTGDDFFDPDWEE